MAERETAARELMDGFAARTGIGRGGTRRYLWTDAFAVCNFLGLAEATGDGRHVERALRLVDEVHRTLGRHRPDDARHGWISGLPAAEGDAHPTCGGLRIGKPLPEREPAAPFDDRLEWERDGQYFHYATKWMHALDQGARALGQPLFNTWARELAHAAHRGFVHGPHERRRMYWKVSIDLTRPLVPSMGQHDPLDGFLTCLALEATAAQLRAPGPSLTDVVADFAALVDPAGLATADALGIGGLLVDAYRADQLGRAGALARHDELCGMLLDAALVGLRAWVRSGDLRHPAHHRLAFRELGLSIGLAALGLLERAAGSDAAAEASLGPRLAAFSSYAGLRGEIESFWLRPEHRQGEPWSGHVDINEVMLATALMPGGFLVMAPARTGGLQA
jgi:hypothetical protein